MKMGGRGGGRGEGIMFGLRINHHAPATAVPKPCPDSGGAAGNMLAELPNVATLGHQLINAERATSPPSLRYFTEVKSEKEMDQTWEKRGGLVYQLKNLTKIYIYLN